MGRSGEAVTFITAEDERKWNEIERGLGRRFTKKPWRSVRKAMSLPRQRSQDSVGSSLDSTVTSYGR